MLKVEHLTKLYDGKHGCNDISFSLEKGEVLGVVGSNGSGKTTTFKCLLQLLLPDSGSMTLDAEPLTFRQKPLFGFLPEERCLYKDLKVYEQIELIGKLKKMSSQQIEQEMDLYLEKLGIPDYQDLRIAELSKGNQQKIQLICALLNDPQVLVLDEPLSGMDVLNAQRIKELLREESEKGKIILLSSHQFDAMEEFFDKVLLIREGKSVYYGKEEELRKSSPIRYISLISTQRQDYYMEDGVVQQSVSGNTVRLMMENETKAMKLFRKLLKTEELNSFTIELPTLKDIIRENQLL